MADFGPDGRSCGWQRRGNQTAKLSASDGAGGDTLGDALALKGDTIVAGALGDTVGANGPQGSVYSFARTGAAVRMQTAKLTVSAGAADANLGWSVAIDAAQIVAGAPGIGAGFAYSFARTGAAARTETATLAASDGAAFDNLGFSVALDADEVVAGALTDTVGANASQGSLNRFAPSGAAVRSEAGKRTASSGGENDNLGYAIAIDAVGILAGAPGRNSSRGSASIFFAPPPPAPVPPAPVASPQIPPPPVASPPVGGGTPGGPSGGDVDPPRFVGAAKAVLQTFAVGSSRPRGRARGRGKIANGTTFRYALSEAGRVVFTIERESQGRNVARTCSKRTRANRGRRRCARYVRVGAFAQRASTGLNRKGFSGRIATRRLSPGGYRATLDATDAAANKSTPRQLTFKVVQR